MKQIDIITIFPEAVTPYLETSILKRAQASGRVRFGVHDLRKWAEGKHRKVDDRPYGGGAGMVMMVEPFFKALRALKAGKLESWKAGKRRKQKTRVLLTSAKGKLFTQRDAERLAKKYDRLVILCGHYEGVDERVAEHLVDEEVSIGSYVLTGGELPALVIADAVTRLIPGVLGNEESTKDESHTKESRVESRESRGRSASHVSRLISHASRLEYPQYTRPDDFSPRRGVHWRVPKVLLSGNHKEIEQWREQHRG